VEELPATGLLSHIFLPLPFLSPQMAKVELQKSDFWGVVT
jgi:hypothetical protein